MDIGAAVREKQIPRSFSRINNALDELEKQLIGYTDTLNPILTPSQPRGVESGNEKLSKQEIVAPFATTLNDIELRIRSMSNRITDLFTRTEI